MKVKEFIEELSCYPKHGDDVITVEKHDKNQLCCFGTVPIKRWQFGFDWEHGQVILEPEVDLCTSLDVQNEMVHKQIDDNIQRLMKHSLLASRMARMIYERETDDGLKRELIDMLKEF